MSAALAEYRLEDAFQTLLKAQEGIAAAITASTGSEFPFDVYTGVSLGDIDYSCIHVIAASAEPIEGPYRTGSWLVNISVSVVTSIKSGTKEEHYARVRYAREVTMRTDLKAALEAVAPGLVIGEPRLSERRNSIMNGCWVHETNLIVPCADGA